MCIRDRRSGAPYGMSKAAMHQMTRNLAVEWAEDGVRVNCVAPWYIRTRRTQGKLSDPDYLDEVLLRTPLGRIGEPEEVAAGFRTTRRRRFEQRLQPRPRRKRWTCDRHAGARRHRHRRGRGERRWQVADVDAAADAIAATRRDAHDQQRTTEEVPEKGHARSPRGTGGDHAVQLRSGR